MRVVVSLRARSDILAAHSYFVEHSPAAADRLLPRLSQRFDELSEFPFLGRDRSEFGASIRGLLVDGYVAFYKVEQERVVIIRVIDGRRDIDREMLK